MLALCSAPMAAIVLMQGNPFQAPTLVSPGPIEEAVEGLVVEASVTPSMRTVSR
ncbi:MAG: hypothetical protein RIS35_2324 [Pseudomonadota bacterium]|jgi:hypothetical protein